MSVCLVIIYNHRFEQNINKLNSYYKDRFDHIYHVIPFYQSEDENVITVYENSHQFNGYIAQAFKSFYSEKFGNYVFAGDDLLLNPSINQNNITAKLNLKPNSAYIKNLYGVGEVYIPWYHIPKILYKFVSAKGINIKNEIPDKVQAEKIALSHGMKNQNFKFKNFIKHVFVAKTPLTLFKNLAYTLGFAYLKRFRKILEIPYPIVVGYSDFFVIPKSSIHDFIHYCGVFAGMNLFVEAAIPTALLLSSEKIQCQSKSFKGVEIWKESEIEELMIQNELSVENLFKNNSDKLYFHPIKLSKWNIK